MTNKSTAMPATDFTSAALRPSLMDEGLLTEDDYIRLTYSVKVIVAPALLLGIAANTIAIFVYLRMPSSVTSTYFCLTSGLDIMYLLSVLPTTFISLVMGQEQATRNVFYMYYVRYVNGYITSTMRHVILCATMMMSMDRFLVVAFPFRTRTLQHLRRPRLYIFALAVMAFILDVHKLLKNKVVVTSGQDSFGNKVNSIRIMDSEMGLKAPQLFLDLGLVSSVLFRYIPLGLLVLFNGLLLIALARHSRAMKTRLSGSENAQDSAHSQNTKDRARDTMNEEVSKQADCAREKKTVNGKSDQSAEQSSGGNLESRNTVHEDTTSEQAQNVGDSRKRAGGDCYSCYDGDQQNGTTAADCHEKRSHPFRDQQSSVTKTVLIYSVLFTLLALPDTVFPAIRRFVPGLEAYQREHYLILARGSLSSLLDTLSSTMNFFVYLATGSSFRRGVRSLFQSKKSNVAQPSGTLNSTILT